MASHRRGCWRSCGDSAAPSHTQGGGATAAFIDSSTVGDDEGKPGERKLKKERISKECGFASLAETDFPFLLDELLRASVNGTIVPGDRWSPTSQLSSSPIPGSCSPTFICADATGEEKAGEKGGRDSHPSCRKVRHSNSSP